MSTSHTRTLDTLAIIGLGLMGASLGLAVRQRGLARHVVGHARREAVRTEALRRGVVDAVAASAAEAVRHAELVVYCLPVLAIPDAVRECSSAFPAGCVVTDVGSTKAELEHVITPMLAGTGATFLGSHPIAGAEQTGMEAARADLYSGAVVVVTPIAGQEPAGMARVRALWEGVGSRVAVMSPGAHDAMLARTSHLPHLVAAVLTRAVLGRGDMDVASYCGSGFRDTTRIAGGSQDLWHDIVKSNQAAIATELAAYAKELGELQALVARRDTEGLREFLAQARQLREGLTTHKEGNS